jgi:putative DNA primase/helicase
VIVPQGSRPRVVTDDEAYGNFPEAVKSYDRWMGTRFESRSDGKLDKPPYRVRSGSRVRKAAKNKPENWATFEEAHAALERGDVDAIGFVFTKDDPFTVIDLDGVIDPVTGEIEDQASNIQAQFHTYWEMSISGRGLHIICEAEKPDSRCRTGNVELYDGRSGARFMVLTGRGSGRDVQPCQDAVNTLYEEIFGNARPRETRARDTRHRGKLLDRGELLAKARDSKYGAKFVKLYDHGDRSGFDSPNEADYALINILIFWCAGDEDRIEDLLKSSALYRPPPEKHKGYVRISVQNALKSYKGSYYQPKALRTEPTPKQRDVLAPHLALLLDASRWKGQKAAGAYKAYAAMVIEAAEIGVVTDQGELHVGSDVRTLAEKAGISRETLSRSSLPYLVEKKRIKWRRGAGNRRGQFILRTPDVPSDVTIKVSTQYFNGDTYGDGLGALAKLIRMRTGTANTGRALGLGEMHKVARLGMVAMFCMVTLTTAPRGLTAEELVERTGRRRDHVLNTMRKLVDKSLVIEPREGFFTFAEGFWSAYEKELRRSLIVVAERRQRKQHKKERWENAQNLKEGRAQWHAKRDAKVISLDAERRRKLDKAASYDQPTDGRYLTEREKAQLEEDVGNQEYDRKCKRVRERLSRLLEERRGGGGVS